ncbi:MAG: hypothetical protein JWO94_80 [Verrucomicrobiaceae bacterium]|nr:hypothetical protein [Verrucomicrobiaceae bacterium]
MIGRSGTKDLAELCGCLCFDAPLKRSESSANCPMNKNRLEAFSDGVIAIIITVMVLEMKVPQGSDWTALRSVLPVFLSYVLSFIYVGVYWNNHHHLLHVTEKINGRIMWANLHLLFWQSLVPFVTGWMGENHFAAIPMALYGFILLMAAIAYAILQHCIIALQGRHALLGEALGRDRKGKFSMVFYVIAIALSFVNAWLAGALYVLVALMWFLPDRRIEKQVERQRDTER